MSPDPKDPRVWMRNHAERGPTKYTYTIEDVAKVANRAVATVHQQLGSKISDLVEVMSYARRAKEIDSKKIQPLDIDRVLNINDTLTVESWAGRWPPLDFYPCSGFECDEVLLGQIGYCERCGGRRVSWLLDDKGYFCMWINGKYVRFHRIAASDPPNMDVHHIDFNKLNNKHHNLQILTHEDHWKLHNQGTK